MQEETAVHLTHTEQQTTKHISLLLLHVHTVSVLLHGLLWSYSGLGCPPPKRTLGWGIKGGSFYGTNSLSINPNNSVKALKETETVNSIQTKITH